MTRGTALTIQTNPDDLLVEGVCDANSGKQAGFIYLTRLGRIHSTLISTNPGYDTELEAKEAMDLVIKEVKELEL